MIPSTVLGESPGDGALLSTGGPRDGRLTVVMPTRNHAPYIRRALDSLVAQIHRPHRILVLDDASTDETPGILRAYAERYDFISVVTHEQNRGTVPRMHEGLATVESEYVLFMSSDDFIDITLCAKSLELMDRNPQAAFCAVQVIEVDEQGRFQIEISITSSAFESKLRRKSFSTVCGLTARTKSNESGMTSSMCCQESRSRS